MLDTYKQVVVNQDRGRARRAQLLHRPLPRCALERSGCGASPFVRLSSTRCSMAMYTLGILHGLRDQPFHRENAASFRDYEELEDREPALLYERAFIKRYVEHCRARRRQRSPRRQRQC